MAARIRPQSLTIVIKLGTSSIVSPSYPFLPHLHLLSSIVETVIHLRELGHRVVLVSSGAIGVGLRRMGLKERGKGLSHKQALAAVGQGRLIALWDNLFSQLDQPIAQILLTRMDISDRTRYLNAQNTFLELLQMGVVPIVNENDTVSVSEIKFGDNDTLSAISSNIVHADYLFLLTDVDCLYTDNPRVNPDAQPVRVVRDIEKVKQQVSTSTLGTSLGTGGMSTKLIAAELATAAGVTTVIMHSEKVRDIFGIIEKGAGPSRETADVGDLETGPLCTRFLRRETALKDRKWWIAHGLHAAGTVVIDEGAYRAITRRESGGRLLPAGVVRVEGVFASHQAVRIICRRKRRSTGAPSTAPASADRDRFTPLSRTSIDLVSGDVDSSSPSSPALRAFHHARLGTSGTSGTGTLTPDAGGLPEGATQPGTPTIQPALSLSSSIASLDPLSRTVPSSPAMHAVTERLIATTLGGGTAVTASTTVTGMSMAQGGAQVQSQSQQQVVTAVTGVEESANTSPDALLPIQEGEVGLGEWEEVDVGKGLAQYNSLEIDRIKGMKSSHIEQVLGYCDSEHVVDSIAFV